MASRVHVARRMGGTLLVQPKDRKVEKAMNTDEDITDGRVAQSVRALS